MRPPKLLAMAMAAVGIALAQPAFASDHFDGPFVLSDPSIDITDMYVFPSPENPERVVLIMNVLPNAGSSKWFSGALEYRFRLRPVSIKGTGANAGFEASADEVVFSCTFDEINDTAQYGRCRSPDTVLDLAVGETTGDDEYASSGMRVFAGARLDPFFMDVPGIVQSMEAGALRFTNQNSAQGANCLSIIVEIDAEALLPDPSGLYGVVGEIRTRGSKPFVLDTFGRPELANVVLSSPNFDEVNRTVDVRDLFNRYDPFAPSDDYAELFRGRLNANLHRLDSLDGQIDWPMEDGVHPLAELHLADFTVIDLAKPVANGSWLEIERAIVAGRDHVTGGGRWLDDDICDIQYSFLIAADQKRISDGVDQPTKLASNQFPFLHPPRE